MPAIGRPLLWWAACFALLYLLYRWGLRRDWRAGAVLCTVAAGYLPWFVDAWRARMWLDTWGQPRDSTA